MTVPPSRPSSPTDAWRELTAGNARFVRDEPAKPEQDRARREEIATKQTPFALVFGCSDSRVAAEIVFDQGLGHLFVVRTAGHVVDTGVMGSIEFGVGVLGVSVVVVLGHDRCGAVAASMKAAETGELPAGYLRDLVERVTPSVLAARRAGATSADQVEAEHVRQTARLLVDRSPVLSDAIAAGRCGVVGLTYALVDGAVRLIETIGTLDVTSWSEGSSLSGPSAPDR
ncbi:MAG: carbonic anhydrase [Actinomycetota bacterium]